MKLSELKNFIRENIISTLSEDIQDDIRALDDYSAKLDAVIQKKEEAGIDEEEHKEPTQADLKKTKGLAKAKEELALNIDKLQILEQKITLKDSIIVNLNSQIGNFNSILNTKSDQLALSRELSQKLQNDLKKQKLTTKLVGGAGIVAVLGVVILIK